MQVKKLAPLDNWDSALNKVLGDEAAAELTNIVNLAENDTLFVTFGNKLQCVSCSIKITFYC